MDPEEKRFKEFYGSTVIHGLMLRDKVRTGAYERAIRYNKHLFKDKVVLDIGCGTGILSLFAAEAGAQKVYAVDFSSLTPSVVDVVARNRFSHIIEVINDKVENISFPPIDIIISEWMGNCLFYENVLPAVIYCRNKWLKPGGLIFPDKAKLYISAAESMRSVDPPIEALVCFHGFNFSAMRNFGKTTASVFCITQKQLVTNEYLIKDISLYTVQESELDYEVNFELEVLKNRPIDSFLCYFTVEFSHGNESIILSTAPDSPPTHWCQTFFYLDEILTPPVQTPIRGSFKWTRVGPSKRGTDVSINYSTAGTPSTSHQKFMLRIT